jgi:hypothetical protein
VAALLAAKANPNLYDPEVSHGAERISHSIMIEDLRTWVQDQATPLYMAIFHEQDNKALALIKARADVNIHCLQVGRSSRSMVFMWNGY